MGSCQAGLPCGSSSLSVPQSWMPGPRNALSGFCPGAPSSTGSRRMGVDLPLHGRACPRWLWGHIRRGPSRASPMRSRWAPLKSHDFGWLNGPRPRPNAGPRMRVLARKVGYSPENLPLLPLRIRPSRGPLCPTKLGAPGPASCVTRRQYSKPLIIRQDPSGRARPGIRDNSRRSPQNRRGPLHPGSLSKCHCLSATW